MTNKSIPKTKMPKLVEIVPDMYPNLLFPETSLIPLIFFKVVQRFKFVKNQFIAQSSEWERVAVRGRGCRG